MKRVDRVGHRYGRLVVESEAPSKARGGKLRVRWSCRCDCGGSKVVGADELRDGRTSSCGCLDRESRIARNKARKQRVRPLIDNGDGTLSVVLTQGKTAIVDASDESAVAGHNWHAIKNNKSGTYYAVRAECSVDSATQVRVWMHREIRSAPDHLEVDHRDGDGLNNRRENLRLATTLQNRLNTGLQRNNKSGRVGVYVHANKWRAHISNNGRLIHLGTFDTVEEAAAVREAAEAKFYGEWSGHESRRKKTG